MSAHDKIMSKLLAEELREAMQRRGFHKSYASKFLGTCDETLDDILRGDCDVSYHEIARGFIERLNEGASDD